MTLSVKISYKILLPLVISLIEDLKIILLKQPRNRLQD